jgi:exopolysaccharide biosynthesis predicted pyruvyltransferase EpsI
MVLRTYREQGGGQLGESWRGLQSEREAAVDAFNHLTDVIRDELARL